MIRKYAKNFCWKNVSSFCSAKATHIFSAKNIRILCIESAKTVNEMTLNELVKLTRLWTTGHWYFFLQDTRWNLANSQKDLEILHHHGLRNEEKMKPRTFYLLTLTVLWTNSAEYKLMMFSYFSQKAGFDIHANCLLGRQGDNFHEMSNPVFQENIPKCHLLEFLPSILRVNSSVRMSSCYWKHVRLCCWKKDISRTTN